MTKPSNVEDQTTQANCATVEAFLHAWAARDERAARATMADDMHYAK